MDTMDNNQKTVFKKLKKIFLWFAVVVLIGEFIFGAIVILFNNVWTPAIGRIQATLFLAAVASFVGVNNLTRIEKNGGVVGGFAWLSFVSNMVWLLLAILLIWEIVPAIEYKNAVSNYGYWGSYTYRQSVMSMATKILTVAVSLASSGFFISNVLAIKETVKQVKPLKITAVVCESYVGIFSIIAVVVGYENFVDDWTRWVALAGLAGFAFVVTALIALIISKSNAKKEAKQEDVINNEQTQKVIQEMVEKEVQARMAAKEKETKTNESAPLSQVDSSKEVDDAPKEEVVVEDSETTSVHEIIDDLEK